jgi:acyl-CoA reductase-like NAD-dependent aldehyde dehydrogenase
MLDIKAEISQSIRNRFYIGGEWVQSHSTRRVSVVNPATELELVDVPLADTVDVDHAIAAARHAFDDGPWTRMTGVQRSDYLRRFVELLARRADLLGWLWTAQVGAPVSFADSLIQTGLARYKYYTEPAADYSFEDRRATARGHARARREPVGVAALIVPWNATFPIMAHKLGAALAAGCTCILKSPVGSPIEGLVVAECAAEAGIPNGVVNVITADRAESAYLTASPLVDKISFTGSVTAGRQIGLMAADRMARATLELGGKSAAILLEDVDLKTAIPSLVPSTVPFSGQVCFSQTRILAHRSRVNEVTDAYVQSIRNLRVGDPWDRQTQIGAVLNARQLDRILSYISQGVRQGGDILIGGGRSANVNRGFYIDPTVFANVTSQMSITREEIFGPVVTIQAYEDEDEAVHMANDTDLGLSGSVFSPNVEQAYKIACRVRTGQVGINGVELAPSVPFGGFKFSGIGREGGPEGLEAFLETKSIFMPVPG